MINQLLAPVMTNDKLREAEKARLTNYATRSRKSQAWRHLAILACRIGLTSTC
jgi:hypothetical protein